MEVGACGLMFLMINWDCPAIVKLALHPTILYFEGINFVHALSFQLLVNCIVKAQILIRRHLLHIFPRCWDAELDLTISDTWIMCYWKIKTGLDMPSLWGFRTSSSILMVKASNPNERESLKAEID
ncbi:hypothetical protein VNO80_10547 [Phaseolus coccineus]|uniref:Uncharacterized protein n=1 Tax=Phaseolus coccineus TaxID=3886 RepID=A0AAN9N8V8_PHACN